MRFLTVRRRARPLQAKGCFGPALTCGGSWCARPLADRRRSRHVHPLAEAKPSACRTWRVSGSAGGTGPCSWPCLSTGRWDLSPFGLVLPPASSLQQVPCSRARGTQPNTHGDPSACDRVSLSHTLLAGLCPELTLPCVTPTPGAGEPPPAGPHKAVHKDKPGGHLVCFLTFRGLWSFVSQVIVLWKLSFHTICRHVSLFQVGG